MGVHPIITFPIVLLLGVPVMAIRDHPDANSLPTSPSLAIYYAVFTNGFSSNSVYILQAYFNSSNILQVGFYFDSTHAIYTRRKTSSGWTEWKNANS